MAFIVNYNGVEFAYSVSVIYDNNGFYVQLIKSNETYWTSTKMGFSLSFVNDIQQIESIINNYIWSHPDSLKFNNDNYNKNIKLDNEDFIIGNHIIKWMLFYNIPMEILNNIHQLDTKANVIGTPKYTYTYNNRLYNDEVYEDTCSGNTSSIITGTNNTITNTEIKAAISPIVKLDRTNKISLRVSTRSPLSISSYTEMSYKEINTLLSINDFNYNIIPWLALSYKTLSKSYFFNDYINFSIKEKAYLHYILDRILKSYEYYIMHTHPELSTNKCNNLYDINLESIIYDDSFKQIDCNIIPNHVLINYLVCSLTDVMMYINKHLANKIIHKYPCTGICSIPVISVYPKNMFQWVLTNQVSNKIFSLTRIIADGKFVKIYLNNEKDNTKQLLPYINANEKALIMYLKYTNQLNTNGLYTNNNNNNNNYNNYNNNVLYSKYTIDDILPADKNMDSPLNINEDNMIGICSDMLKFIEDGKLLANRYPESVYIEDYGEVKMSPVEGTVLKQMRNTIFNHRIDKKISLEQKLKYLIGSNASDEENKMFCDTEFPSILEEYRIKYKSELITLGKLLGHCIGNYVESTDYFFRKDTVCAQVSRNKMRVISCYDSNDTKTPESNEFEAWLNKIFVLYMATKIDNIMDIMEVPMKDREDYNIEDHIDELYTNYVQIRNIFIENADQYLNIDAPDAPVAPDAQLINNTNINILY